jgi:hypothetical protein
LRFDDLKKLNVTLKRAKYFITCNGTFAEGVLFDPLSIHQELTRQARGRRCKGVLDGQMSLFEAESQSESEFAVSPIARDCAQPVFAQASVTRQPLARPTLAPQSLMRAAS